MQENFNVKTTILAFIQIFYNKDNKINYSLLLMVIEIIVKDLKVFD